MSRLTIGLHRDAVTAMADLTERTGLTQTDVINRAVRLYGLVEAERANGKRLALVDDDGNTERVHVL